MNIPQVDTWFFETLEFDFPDILSVKIVEGIKSESKEYVEVGGEKLGPYFPVIVTGSSRVLRIIFRGVLSFQVVNESLSCPQSEIKESQGLGPVKICSTMEYKKYVQLDSVIEQTNAGDYGCFYLWTEDQTLFVLAKEEPSMCASDEKPSLDLGRGSTYFAR